MSRDVLILWHVSFEKVSSFIPRIPEVRIDGEDGVTPRICVGTQIKSCITAMPSGGSALKGLLHVSKTVPQMTPIIHAYCIVIRDQRVKLIEPTVLKNKYGVLDAESTGEHWLTEQVDFEHRILKVNGAKFEKANDEHGNDGFLIKDFDYDIIKTEPDYTFEAAFRCYRNVNSIDIRQALKVYSDSI